jgi:hypothetical protein
MSDDYELSEQDIAPFIEYFERQNARNEQPYDGVLGRLPQWAPEWHQKQFKATRNRLLDNGVDGKPLSPYIVQGYIKIYTELGVTRDSTIEKPGEQTDGPEWIPPEVMEHVGYLAHLRWAISLGEERGLQELSGKMAVRGAAYTQRTKRGGEKGAEAKREKSDAKKIVQIAQGLLRNGRKRRELAGILAQRFSVSKRQINRILKKAGM